jgi:alpha-ribazole phosphatase
MTTRVVLVRHTVPQVAPGLCYGRLDVPLAASWPADLEQCLRSVPTAMHVFSSPARRCLALAEAIAARDGVDVVEDRRLLELDFGRWEGVRWDDIPRIELDLWCSEVVERAPGGGECLRSLWERVARFADELRNTPAGTIVIVGHHGSLRCLYALLAGQSPQEIWQATIPSGGVIELSSRIFLRAFVCPAIEP